MSTSVIDALIVTLGLDGSGFKRGIQDADDARKKAAQNESKLDKEREQATKKAVDGYRSIRNELLAVASIFTAGVGVKNFITDTINSAANLGFLSQNLRMSTEDLTSWQRASERAGGSAGGIIAQLKESADTLAQLKSGFGPNEGLQNFFRFGGNADELKDGNTYLLARSRIIADLFRQDPSKAALVAKQMGISEDQFNFIKQGPQAVLALVQAQEKNAAITEKNAEDALKFKNRMLDLRDSLQTTATKLLVALLPTFEKFVGLLDGWAQKISENKGAIEQWADAVNNFDWAQLAKDARAFASDIAEITKNVRELIDRWDEWTGHSKVQTPGVTKLPGAIRIGKTEDLNEDNKRTGKPVGPATGRPKNETLAKINDYLDEGIARTLASFGVQSAKEWIRDHTGKDDYGAGARSVGRSAREQIAGKSKIDYIKSQLQKMGWNAEQAAGITASFVQESALDPGAVNPKSGAYGLGQWLGSRVKDFKAWSGHELQGSSLDEQLRFFQYEVTKGKEKSAGDALRAAKTAEQAARIHSEMYERPGYDEANIARRQKIAGQISAASRVANARAVGEMPALASAGAAPAAGSAAAGPVTNTTYVDTINVNTKATDAQGIAKAIGPAVQKHSFANQANTGQN